MNLQLNFEDLKQLTRASHHGSEYKELLRAVAIDSRKIYFGRDTAFFALKGHFRDGHQFLFDAYGKGVRVMIVQNVPPLVDFPDATFLLVKDVLGALQELAAFHRRKFNYPVIGITGSAGKTTVKEWLYQLLSPEMHVIRSPKSYNSQIGVALSLLELSEEHELAILEAGISHPNEMERLAYMIRPTHGIFTSLGKSHEENFRSREQHLEEKLNLFKDCSKVFVSESIFLTNGQLSAIHGEQVKANDVDVAEIPIPFEDRISRYNALLAYRTAAFFLQDSVILRKKISDLTRPALRLETFEGVKGSIVINDTYNLDPDALQYALEYQLQLADGKPRIVLLGIDEENESLKEKAVKVIQQFDPNRFEILRPDERIDIDPSQAVILIKGTRAADMQRVAMQFRLKKHKTYLEIDLSALRHNLSVFKTQLPAQTKLLAMVKAQSYGSGSEKLARFLELQGVDYLGVAYADEGVELRTQGINLPILVMNAEEESFEECIHYQLEPAIYSIRQLDLFIKELILQSRWDYPIHIKIETGMKRLGFEWNELPEVMDMLQAQPEVRVSSVYSHLSESDNRRDKRFTELQLSRFEQAVSYFEKHLSYPFDKHILNSEGVANYPEAAYSMVRMGIGMYGISSNPTIKNKLNSVLTWNSSVSQLKLVRKGESAGYSRSFIAEKDTVIAIIPVGYADGFRRELSNGKGKVFIHGKACRVVGKVCMDMLLVDASNLPVKEGDPVEIIGPHQSLEELAASMNTIPYEVMTSISKRVHRVFTEH